MTTNGPIVLVVEDLHWADPSTLRTLHRLTASSAPLPVVLVVSTRPLPRQPGLVVLFDDWSRRGACRIDLGPLSQEESCALVEAIVTAPIGPNLVARLGAGGGNPLFLTEMTNAFLEAGAIAFGDDGTADVGDGGWPSSLPVLILSRLSFLPPSTIELLGLASVFGNSFSIADLAAMVDRTASTCWDQLRPAFAAGLLVEDRDHLAFRHQLIRDALYEDLPLSVRVGLHQDLVGVLHRSGAPAVAVAAHVLRSARPGDVEAITWLQQAATEEASRAPAVAVELLEAALDLARHDQVRSIALRADLGPALLATGRNQEAEAILVDALGDGVTPERDHSLRVSLLSSLLLRGDARRAYDEARRAADATPVDVERARFTVLQALAALHLCEWDEAARLARQAEAVGDVPVQVQALSLLGQLAFQQARPAEAVVATARAVSLAAEAGTSEAHGGIPDVIAALALVEADRMDDATAAVAAGRVRTEPFATPANVMFSHLSAAHAHLWAGELDDSLVDLQAAEAIGEEAGAGWAVEIMSSRALIACWQG
ncbi:MAG: ATP-binding protein, partial [Acidimicrobiales bacterium]